MLEMIMTTCPDLEYFSDLFPSRHLVVLFSFSLPDLSYFRQVYHLSTGAKRFTHERANNSYEVLPAFFADLTSAAFGVAYIIPLVPVPYYMMGLPTEAFPFVFFTLWLVSNRSSMWRYCSIVFHHLKAR